MSCIVTAELFLHDGFRFNDIFILFCSFTLKKRDGDGTDEMTVLDYFTNVRKIDLRYSADLPCINVGRPKRPTYFPIEVKFSFFICFMYLIHVADLT